MGIDGHICLSWKSWQSDNQIEKNSPMEQSILDTNAGKQLS